MCAGPRRVCWCGSEPVRDGEPPGGQVAEDSVKPTRPLDRLVKKDVAVHRGTSLRDINAGPLEKNLLNLGLRRRNSPNKLLSFLALPRSRSRARPGSRSRSQRS